MRRFKIILLGICVMALLWIVAVRLLPPKEITDPYLPEHLRGSPEKPKSPASPTSESVTLSEDEANAKAKTEEPVAENETELARELEKAEKRAARDLEQAREKAAKDLAEAEKRSEEEIASLKAMAALQLVDANSTSSMVLVPGGEFTMGFEEVATPEHKVRLSPFFIGRFEVTYELWLEVRNFGTANGYFFHLQGRAGTPWAPALPGNAQPVTEVGAWDAMVWCNAYSEMEGRKPVYTSNEGKIIRHSRNSDALTTVVFDRKAKGYRLPTEAEWEYAARFRGLGESSPGNFASGAIKSVSDVAATDEVAWFSSNSFPPLNHPRPVGKKKPNRLGLHDMSGNVFEWCWDRMGQYPETPQTNPAGPDAGGRLLRGGSYGHGDKDLRASHRISSNPVNFSVNVGFRCARAY